MISKHFDQLRPWQYLILYDAHLFQRSFLYMEHSGLGWLPETVNSSRLAAMGIGGIRSQTHGAS